MGVFGAKNGTKTWTNTPKEIITKPEGGNNLTPQQMASLGGEDIADVLNKAADPNWIYPSKKMRAVGSDKLDKDAFMKLMLAQMKNQDPTNPLKSHEMAAQLAQFTSVEQLTNINTGIQELKASAKPTESFQALNFIGKSVAGDSSNVIRAKGDTNHDFSFTLPDDAQKVTIKVVNASTGDLVRKVDINSLKKGNNNWNWNGHDERDLSAPVGEYKFSIEAISKSNQKMNVKTDFDGMITGVSYTPEGPVLIVGNQTVKLKDVKKIVDPSLKKNDQNVNNVQTQDLKNQPSASENEISKGAKEGVPSPMQNLMSSVSLSGDMKNKLQKELK